MRSFRPTRLHLALALVAAIAICGTLLLSALAAPTATEDSPFFDDVMGDRIDEIELAGFPLPDAVTPIGYAGGRSATDGRQAVFEANDPKAIEDFYATATTERWLSAGDPLPLLDGSIYRFEDAEGVWPYAEARIELNERLTLTVTLFEIDPRGEERAPLALGPANAVSDEVPESVPNNLVPPDATLHDAAVAGERRVLAIFLSDAPLDALDAHYAAAFDELGWQAERVEEPNSVGYVAADGEHAALVIIQRDGDRTRISMEVRP